MWTLEKTDFSLNCCCRSCCGKNHIFKQVSAKTNVWREEKETCFSFQATKRAYMRGGGAQWRRRRWRRQRRQQCWRRQRQQRHRRLWPARALLRAHSSSSRRQERKVKSKHGLMVQEVQRGWGRKWGYRSRTPASPRSRLVSVVAESHSTTSADDTSVKVVVAQVSINF